MAFKQNRDKVSFDIEGLEGQDYTFRKLISVLSDKQLDHCLRLLLPIVKINK